MRGKRDEKNNQIKVVWNVENLKVSFVNSFETNKLAGYLSRIYGELTVNRGNVHDYLGMYLDYSKQGTVDISIIK